MNKQEWLETKQARTQEKEESSVRSRTERERQKLQVDQADAERKASASRKTHESYVKLGRPIVEKSGQSFVYMDVKTSGKPGDGSILSVTAVMAGVPRYLNGRPIKTEPFHRDIIPHSSVDIPWTYEHYKVNGFESEQRMEEGIPVDQSMYELDLWLEEQAAPWRRESVPVFTAYDVGNSFSWIDHEMVNAGIEENPFGDAGYCLRSLATSLGLLRRYKGGYSWVKTATSNLSSDLMPTRGEACVCDDDILEGLDWQQELHYAIVGCFTSFDKAYETRTVWDDRDGEAYTYQV